MRVIGLLLGLGGCAADPGKPGSTCESAASFVDPGGVDWLFELPDPSPERPEGVLPLSVCLEESAVAALRVDRDAEVAAALGTPWGTAPVQVTLKGKEGNSFQPIDNKPYLKVSLPDGAAAVREFRLYNLWQDVGQVQGYLGYRLWRLSGYPAPRMGYAHVTLNGRDLGLYGVIEEIDETFVASRPEDFPTAGGSLYEGEYGADLTAEQVADLETVIGPRGQLDALVAVIAAHPDLRDQEVTPQLDFGRWAHFWALEVLVGAQEGYSALTNNYYLYEDPQATSGRFTMLPWGFDMTLYHVPPPELPQGVLASQGLASEGSRALMLETLACDTRRVPWEALSAEMERVIPMIAPVYEAQFEPESGFTPLTHQNEIPARQAEVAWFLQEHPVWVESWLAEQGVVCTDDDLTAED